MKTLKKNDRVIELETESEWIFNCKTRGPDQAGPNARPIATWTYVLYNRNGERRFIPESRMQDLFRKREA